MNILLGKNTYGITWIILLLLTIFLMPSATAFAATYYVDGANIGGTCSDGALGTGLTTPWCTVGKAASTAVAGDTINIRSGTYREVVTPLNSGTAVNPITYQSYLSETPIVSAAIAGTGWESLGITESTSGLFTDGFENNDNTFQNYNSGAGVTVDAGNTLLIQSSTTNNGAYALAATFGGTLRNARVATTLSTSSDVFQRMYFRINSSYDIISTTTGQIIMNLRMSSATSSGSVELLQNAGGQFYLRGRAVNPATTTVSVFGATAPGSIVPNTWYSIELRYKGGATSTGGAELWLNGSSTGSIYTFNTSSTTITRAEWGGGTSGTAVAASGSVLYIDDIKVASTTIGAFVAAGPANIYKMTNVTGDPNNIFENDVRMATGSSATTLTAGTYFYDAAGDILYVRTSDSSNPNTKTIDIPFRNEGFLIVNKQYLVFDDIAVKYNDGAGALDGAYVIATSSYITVQNSDIVDNFGSGVYLHKATSSTVSNNQILRNQRDFGGGLRFENGSDNNLVVDNTITGLGVSAGNGINLCGDGGCGYVGNNNNTIRRNTFYNLRDSCVYVGSLSDNNILEQNSCGLTFRANGVGGTGFHVSRGSDYNIIRNNIFFDMYGASVVIQSNTIDAVETPVYGNKVLNNVIYNSATSLIGNHGGISVLDDAYDTIILNNIIYQANDVSGLRVTGAAATSTFSDYNLYYSTQPTATNMFHWGVTSGTFYTNLANFRVAYPTLEANSISVDPQFILASALNFLLATTSPAINIGTTTAFVLNDYLGVVRPQGARYDLGVYERLSAADVTAPVISAVASSTSTSSATITWTTNELADGQIIYGTTISYGATSTLNASLVTSHSETLTGLTPNTTYNFKIKSADASGNSTTSTNYTFTTTATPDVTAPTVAVTTPANGTVISGTAVTLSATASDNIAIAGVRFFINGIGTGAEDLVAPYSVIVDSTLLANGSISVTAVARDTSSNVATSSAITLTVDNLSPVISAVASSTSTSSATITWTTNELADGQVEYGINSLYGVTTPIIVTPVLSHSVALTGLSASTVYHFRVRSVDGVSNVATSSDYTFTTTPTPTTSGGSSGGSSGGGGGKSRSVTPKVGITVPLATQLGITTPVRFREIRFTLGPNMKNDEVALLQQMLASDVTLYPEGDITGVYGPLTQRAVERFQIKYGLLTNGTPLSNGFGNVGPLTMAKLNAVFATVIVNQEFVPVVPANKNDQKIAQLTVLLNLLKQLLAIVLSGQR